jgi:hypothetical protein
MSKPAVEDEEELVGICMQVPDVLPFDVGDPHIVVVHAGLQQRPYHARVEHLLPVAAGRPELIEGALAWRCC